MGALLSWGQSAERHQGGVSLVEASAALSRAARVALNFIRNSLAKPFHAETEEHSLLLLKLLRELILPLLKPWTNT